MANIDTANTADTATDINDTVTAVTEANPIPPRPHPPKRKDDIMTDLHAHILPGMDDGAKDMETALQMLSMEANQGVKTVALTPHFYRSEEHIADFLERRELSWNNLLNNLTGVRHPQLILSAEVGYVTGMADWPELEELCYSGTKLLLLEPPMTLWNDEMFRQLYAIEVRRGITPMIAHFDRYLRHQPKVRIEQLLEMGLPIQVSAASLLNFTERKRALKLITDYGAVPVTDCHNISTRPPNLEAAARIISKKLGNKADEILHYNIGGARQ